MNNNLSIAPPPHLLSKQTDAGIMRDVIIALLLPTAAAVYLFGFGVLFMCALGIASAVMIEAGWQVIMGKQVTVRDGSAAVTGFLVALSLPVTAPIWSILLGNAFAIVVVKQLQGGIGIAILIMNAFSRPLDRILRPRVTGHED